MSCTSEIFPSTITVDPRTSESEPKIRPCALSDSTRRDPVYVWGDEGPINDRCLSRRGDSAARDLKATRA